MRSMILVTVACGAMLALAGCTADPATPTAAPSPTVPETPQAGGTGSTGFPSCEAVAGALVDLLAGLSYDADRSQSQTAEESYDQRVCVYSTTDGAAQIGVTFAAIPFLETELETYGQLPNALQDERLGEFGGVLQTFETGDGDDGHLDGPLYLFDQSVSITIQGYAPEGGTTVDALPALTLANATDAAFAARALVR